MNKITIVFLLLVANIFTPAQNFGQNKQQTVDYMESIFKNSYVNGKFTVSTVVLEGNTLITTYSDGDIYKKDLMLKGPLKIANRSGKFAVELEGADLIIFGNLKSEQDARKLKNALEQLIDVLKNGSGSKLNSVPSSSSSSSSSNFDNDKLALVYKIFSDTNRKTVIGFMKEKGYDDHEIEPAFDEFGEVLSFSAKYSTVNIEYTTNGKNLSVSKMYAGALNNVFIEMELEEKGYRSITKKTDTSDSASPEKKIWSKPGSRYQFVTLALEKEKVGMLGYGIIED